MTDGSLVCLIITLMNSVAENTSCVQVTSCFVFFFFCAGLAAQTTESAPPAADHQLIDGNRSSVGVYSDAGIKPVISSFSICTLFKTKQTCWTVFW